MANARLAMLVVLAVTAGCAARQDAAIGVRTGVIPGPGNVNGCQTAYGTIGVEAKSGGLWFAGVAWDQIFRIELGDGVPCNLARHPQASDPQATGRTIDLGTAHRVRLGGGRVLRGDPFDLEFDGGAGVMYARGPDGPWHPWIAVAARATFLGGRLLVGVEQGVTRSAAEYEIRTAPFSVSDVTVHEPLWLATAFLAVRFW